MAMCDGLYLYIRIWGLLATFPFFFHVFFIHLIFSIINFVNFLYIDKKKNFLFRATRRLILIKYVRQALEKKSFRVFCNFFESSRGGRRLWSCYLSICIPASIKWMEI